MKTRTLKEKARRTAAALLVLVMLFGECGTVFARSGGSGAVFAATPSDAAPGEEDTLPDDPGGDKGTPSDAPGKAGSGQTELTATSGSAVIKSGTGWMNTGYLNANKPHRIRLIDAAETQTVDGTCLNSWDASADSDGSVRCYLVRENEETILYIAFSDESDSDLLHTEAALQFNNRPGYYEDSVMYYVEEINDLELLDTSQITDMSYMFYGCHALTELNLSSFDTSHVTDMKKMFLACDAITGLNLSSFDTSHVTDMSQMFEGCSHLTETDLSNFGTSLVTDMSWMFRSCSSLRELDLSSFSAESLTNTSRMFEHCIQLESVTFGTFNADKVTDMSYMFYECYHLTDLDLSGFSTAAVTNMHEMFYYCEDLTELDLSGFGTANVTDMYHMFRDCLSLTSLDVSSFNTGSATDMREMFRNCKKLLELDLSGFSTASDPQVWYMFTSCDSLYTITLGENFHPTVSIFPDVWWSRQMQISPSLDGRWYSLTDPEVSYAADELNNAPAGTYQAMPLSTLIVTFDPAGGTPAPNRQYLAPGSCVQEPSSDPGKEGSFFLGWYLGDEPYDFTDEVTADFTLTAHWVTGYTIQWLNYDGTLLAETIAGEGLLPVYGGAAPTKPADGNGTYVFSGWSPQPSPVTEDTSYTAQFQLKEDGKVLLVAEAGNGVLKNGTDWISGLPSNTYPRKLVLTDVSEAPVSVDGTPVRDWKASKDGSVHCYLVSYNNEKILYIAFNEPAGRRLHTGSYLQAASNNTYTPMKYVREVTGLDLLDTSSLKKTDGLFENWYYLTSLDLSGFDTSRVTSMERMFYGCDALTSLDLSSFDTSHVTSMKEMFCGCDKLVSVTWDPETLDTSAVTDMTKMFYQCYALTDSGSGCFDTSSVTDMSNMFNWCQNLVSLDVSGFNTSNVTNMQDMFHNCNKLTSLDVSGFDTSNVTNMRCMFARCSSLTSLNVNGFDTSNVTDMEYMFCHCSKLTSLDVSNFVTSNVTNMGEMFYNCRKVAYLDVSGFDTSKVTAMYRMFCGCSALTELDLSSFRTPSLRTMYGMFAECSGITSLDLSTFDTSAVVTMSATGYNSDIYVPGGTFYGCSSLTSLDLSNFHTSSNVNLADMFYGCSSLTSLDLSSFDTSGVTDMRRMFYNCRNLASLNLSSFDLSATTSYAYMFSYCNSLYEVTIGENTILQGKATLPGVSDARKQAIHQYLDGNWYAQTEGEPSYTPEELYTAPAGTYRAIPSAFCTVDFDADGGEPVPESQHVAINHSASVPTPPSKTGYTLQNWYLGDSPYDFDTAVTENITLKAQWTANTYTIAFDGNGSTSGAMESLTGRVYGSSYTLPENTYQKTGHTFTGWNTKADGTGTAFADEAEVQDLTAENGGTVTLYAQWTANTYTIAFDGNGSTSGAMESLTERVYGSSYTLPEHTYQNTGHTFTRWNTKADGTGTAFADKAEVQDLTAENGGTVTLYAQWAANTYTIAFDGNGGTGSMASMTGLKYGTSYQLTAGAYTRKGYTFTGWNTEADGTGTAFADEADVLDLVLEDGGTVTLYAQWTANTYTIAFDGNGGTGSMASMTGLKYGTGYQLTANAYTRKGYTFTGWNTKANGSGTAFTDRRTVRSVTTVNGRTVKLYAQWAANTYTIAFDRNGGTGSMASMTGLKYGTGYQLTAAAYTRKGYTFTGWNTQKGGTGTAFTDGKKVSSLTAENAGTVTLYAQWTANTYTIAFDRNGGTGSMASMTGLKYGTSYQLTANAYTRKGYTFTGWNTQKGGNGTAFTDGRTVRSVTTINGRTVKLYAQWTANTYTIAFDRNGGTGSMASMTGLKYGTSYQLTANAYTRKGYTFTGWNTKADGSGTAFTDGKTVRSVTTVNGRTVKLYAQWVPVSYKVSFNGNGSTSGSMAKQSRTYNDKKALTANAFKKTGYTFAGWNTKANGKGTAFKNKTTVSIRSTAGTTVLYAQWVKTKYTITYNLNGGTNSSDNPSCYYITTPTITLQNPTRKGYTFAGWYSDAKYKTKVTVIKKGSTGAKTLYAKWKKK